MNVPTITIGPDDNWEISVNPDDLPNGLARVTVTDHGIYVEDDHGAYDLIAFSELLNLARPTLPTIPATALRFDDRIPHGYLIPLSPADEGFNVCAVAAEGTYHWLD